MLTLEQKKQLLADPLLKKLTGISTLSLRDRASALRNQQQPKEEKGFLINVVDRLKERTKNILSEGQQLKIKQEEGKINAITKILAEGGLGAKLVGDTAFDVVFSGLSRAAEKISGVEGGGEMTKNLAVKKTKEFFGTNSGKSALEAIKKGEEGWNWLKTHYPNLAESAVAIARVAETLPVFKTGKESVVAANEIKNLALKTSKEAIKTSTEVVNKAKNPIFSSFNVIKNKITDITSKNPLSVVTEKVKQKTNTLEDIISPKFNATEKAKAIKEGRVTTGSNFPTLGKAPDVVTPATKIKNIANTVRSYIINADKLDQFQLVNKVDEIISGLAKQIKPKLKTLQFSPTLRKQLFDEWNYIKGTQAKSIFYNNTTVKKFQEATETFLKQVNSKLKDEAGMFREWTMADLWDFRIAYDNLRDVERIKKLLKKADLSGEEQLLVDMWVENRNMLNQFIKDAASEVGEDVGKKWKDMSDLFDVIDNISQKGAIDLKGEEDIIRRFLPVKIIR
jgi:hypothetical protein